MAATAPIRTPTPTPIPTPAGLHEAVLGWYDASGRSLPFRGTADPYAVLVSEVMAQQTQIARVGPAWAAFMATFPTVAVLAAAAPADVLRAWRGMGYNRRAINLWRAARAIVEDHGGEPPADVAALQRLPGVGPYTARAVAAIAFGLAVGPVDTNVRRVLARSATGAIDGLTRTALQLYADAVVPPERPADWTHALMDVGATFCWTSKPACGACPAAASCRYAATGGALESGRRAAARTPRFHATSRWLRGRILDRLRDAEPGDWVALGGPIGDHDGMAVGVALRRLADEGLVESHPVDPLTARLPAG